MTNPVCEELMNSLEQHTQHANKRLPITVLSAKSDSDVMFCLQSNQGLRIDRSLVH